MTNTSKTTNRKYDLIVIGGGASGYFSAINAKLKDPSLHVLILEKNRECLQKVKVSGGGRCNVTNGVTDPHELIKNYPRGHEFLLEPFKKFGSKQTFEWFENNGVRLKTENDGRVFPTSNSSQTIIDCFENLRRKLNIELKVLTKVQKFLPAHKSWDVYCKNEEIYTCQKLIVASGADANIWESLRALGHEIIDPVPSLFTFNIKSPELHALKGISFTHTKVFLPQLNLKNSGPMVITHWGLSGPAILRLSAWGALKLAEVNYNTTLVVNWIPNISENEALLIFKKMTHENPKKQIKNTPQFNLQSRFWDYICTKAGIGAFQNWAESGKKTWSKMYFFLTNDTFAVEGKSTFKEEFVTAGGINTHNVNPMTFESKLHSGLFLAGEVLNIDAITGGFNFQAAWTGAYLISESL